MAENADRVRRGIHSRLPVPGGDRAGRMKEGRPGGPPHWTGGDLSGAGLLACLLGVTNSL
jgi:hypothetical protein